MSENPPAYDTRQQWFPRALTISSKTKLRELMERGGEAAIELATERSHFGLQNANCHGGLLYSRSPDTLWHSAVGMFRDVDLAGCYNKILSRMNVYLGQPVVLEPGEARWSLARAIDFASKHSPRDGYFIRVTGDISKIPNTLVPSTLNALTCDNYRSRTAQHRARNRRLKGFQLDFPRELPDEGDDMGAKLFSRRIESGIITADTWLMIQALPEDVKIEYENLNADAVIFYPSELIANEGDEFDALCTQYKSNRLPWETEIDLDVLRMVRTQTLDASYVALRYPIARYAQQIASMREEAQQRDGRKSGADKGFKQLANSMYGVLASKHLETHNFVAANQVTATARAIAFAMMNALNGIQVITDGCTYRLDQIPGTTFSECLRRVQDYTCRRPSDPNLIAYKNTDAIPASDHAFTSWYRDHVKQFFEVSGDDYERLFSIHSLVHKETSENHASTSFDALAVDGSGNYVKCRAADGTWITEDAAMRSYRGESKAALTDWILPTYSSDNLTSPPPITEGKELLSMKVARQKARNALESGIPKVFYPLGMEWRKIMTYKVIKPSSFIFQTPNQREAFKRAMEKFVDNNGCGLEILALRRGSGERRRGSIADIAAQIYRLIQAGETDFTKLLNLTRSFKALDDIRPFRLRELEERRERAKQDLFNSIDARNATVEAQSVGYWVTAAEMVDISLPTLANPENAGTPAAPQIPFQPPEAAL